MYAIEAIDCSRLALRRKNCLKVLWNLQLIKMFGGIHGFKEKKGNFARLILFSHLMKRNKLTIDMQTLHDSDYNIRRSMIW